MPRKLDWQVGNTAVAWNGGASAMRFGNAPGGKIHDDMKPMMYLKENRAWLGAPVQDAG
jgi:hypothetical protein